MPATLTDDQVREVNARNAVECELIDEALGRVLASIAARGWDDDTDIIFTTDHGELQGDFGLLFKGPYHVDSLMRLPLVWRPAPVAVAESQAGPPWYPSRWAWSTWLRPSAPSPVWRPRTGCRAGACPPTTPTPQARGIERVLTQWDSELFGVAVHLRTITRDGWLCTAYLRGAVHDGTEGELYDLSEDPLQRTNRWDDPAVAALRADLLADLWDHQPPVHQPHLALEAPV